MGGVANFSEVGEESIAQNLGENSAAEMSGERESRAQVVTETNAAEENLFESRFNSVMNSLTPVNIKESARDRSLMLEVTGVGTPVNRVSNVMFADGELAIHPVGSVRLAKLSRPHLGSSFRTVASVEGTNANVGLSEIDAMVGQ